MKAEIRYRRIIGRKLPTLRLASDVAEKMEWTYCAVQLKGEHFSKRLNTEKGIVDWRNINLPPKVLSDLLPGI